MKQNIDKFLYFSIRSYNYLNNNIINNFSYKTHSRISDEIHIVRIMKLLRNFLINEQV